MGGAETYFYDISLRDIAGAMNRGLAILYYGATEGAFSSARHPPVELDQFNIIQFKLRVPPGIQSNKVYKNQVLFLRRDMAQKLWHKRSWAATKMIRRVKLSNKPTLEHQRIARLFTPENRPLHIAKFDDVWSNSQRVPLAYSEKLRKEFEVFFLRASGDTLVMKLINDTLKCSLAATDRRDVKGFGSLYGSAASFSPVAEEACVSAFRFE